jgi:hypothetical protein
MHTVLLWKPEGKRQFGRHKRRWEGNIKIDVSERAKTGFVWLSIGPMADRFKYGNEPSGSVIWGIS